MRSKSSERRQAILNAAKAVFEEVGYEQASMAQIAARVGGSKATLYNYFESKEVLFLELIQLAAGLHTEQAITLLHPDCGTATAEGLPSRVVEVLSILDPSADIAETLQAFGERALTTFHSPSMLATRRMVIAAANKSDIGKLFYERGPAKAFKIVENFFAAAMEAGKLRRADPRVAGDHWRGLLNAEVLEAGLYNVIPELAPEEIKAIVARAVDVFMRAYAAEGQA